MFIFVDIGCQERLSDGTVFRNCSFFKLLETNMLNIPPDKPLPPIELRDGMLSYDPMLEAESSTIHMPHVIVADDAFPLMRNIMKPNAQKNLTDGKRIYNYRLSRARRTSKNAFGILANMFRIFFTRINLSPELSSKITLACCILHNLLLTKSTETYTPKVFVDNTDGNGNVVEGAWRKNAASTYFMDLPPTSVRNVHRRTDIRNEFKNYFLGKGQVPWQYRHVYV